MKSRDVRIETLWVRGMSCTHCEERIEKAIVALAGVKSCKANYVSGCVEIGCAEKATTAAMTRAIEDAGYTMAEGGCAGKGTRIAGTLVVIVGSFVLLQLFGKSGVAVSFPVVQVGMGYGMALLIGLITSVHCVAMCGGINLSQSLGGVRSLEAGRARRAFSLARLMPGVLYNGGRLVSYTLVGASVGALGSVLTPSGQFQGIVMLAAGVFMTIMGINMLGLFPALRRLTLFLPKAFTRSVEAGKRGRGPLVIGFLNGFMPCGPLQAMQLFALSTGSAVRGGISMFVFCLGTIPLVFSLGAASGILSGVKGRDFSRRVTYAGAVLIAAMGLGMLSNGWNLTGASPFDAGGLAVASAPANTGGFTPKIEGGVQIVNSTLMPNRYPAIVVQEGIPVRWTIAAPPGSINGCNNRLVVREYGIEHTFRPGDNVIEFTPGRSGRFRYSCWMGMISSTITVVAEGMDAADIPEPSRAPTPAGLTIKTDEVAVAKIVRNYQTVDIRLTDDGFSPAVVVMQRELPTLWNIVIETRAEDTRILFPAYRAMLDTETGENPVQIIPTADFEFSTRNNLFYGYVKVVDNIDAIDVKAIQAEAAAVQTLIYPDAYFD